MIALLALLALTQSSGDSLDVSTALAEARSALREERDRVELMSTAHTDELERLKAEIGRRTDELVGMTLGVAELERSIEELRRERAKLREAHEAAEADLKGASEAARNARPWLADVVDALPPSARREEQMAALGGVEAEGKPVEIVSRILESGRLLLDEATTIDLFRHVVRDPTGVVRDATLLRAGLLLTAYRAGDDMGVAVGAPRGGEGHRWRTGLTPEQVESFDRAFAQLGRGSVPEAVHLPVDVSGQLSVEPRAGGLVWWKLAWRGGPIMVPLVLVALIAVSLIVERVTYLARQERGADELAETILAHCRTDDFDEAVRLASTGKSALERTLGACLEHRGGDRESLDEAAEEGILHELPGLERSLSIIGVLAAVAPMLGLLGTVIGMMRTFETISIVGNGDPSVMAGGIYEALVTTMAGLIVAIPLLLAHGVLSARVDRLVADLERHAASLVRILQGDRPAAL